MKHKKSLPKEERSSWTQEQDEFILSLGLESETCNWKVIADRVNKEFPHAKKSAHEYIKRWQVLVNGIESKEPWTDNEELNMIIAHNKYKNKWSEIATMLKGRNNNTIKNKFYSVFRRIKGKIQKSDYNYDSKLELLEIYYIISLIEYYLKNPTQNPKIKGKRGKDFIYTLIHNLNQEVVLNYKENIQQRAKNEGTMDELIAQLINSNRISKSVSVITSTDHSLPSMLNYTFTTSASYPPNILSANSSLNDAMSSTIKNKLLPKFTPGILEPTLIHKEIAKDMSMQPEAISQGITSTMKNTTEDMKADTGLLIEGISTIKSGTGPNKRETNDIFSNQFKYPEYEIPLCLDLEMMSPPPLFSPPTLSAGPAAAAAGAFRAACFTDLSGEFSEISSLAKTANEERIKLRSLKTDFTSIGKISVEGNSEQKLSCTGFRYGP